jgi:hypothetical protein
MIEQEYEELIVLNQSYCRVCMDSNNLIDITFDTVLVDIVLKTTGLQISQTLNQMPRTVCHECIQQIDQAHELRLKAQETEFALIRLYRDAFESQIEPREEEVKLVIEHAEDTKEESFDYFTSPDAAVSFDIRTFPKTDVTDTEIKDEVNPEMSEVYEEELLKNATHKKPKKHSNQFDISSGSTSTAPNQKFFAGEPIRHKGSAILTFVCDTCGKICKGKHRLQEHLNIHTNSKPFACSLCPASFNAKTTLKRHQLVHKPDARPYSCNVCSKTYRAQHALRFHKLQQHGTHEDRKFSCSLCPKTFIYQFRLNVHMKDHEKSMKKKKASPH